LDNLKFDYQAELFNATVRWIELSKINSKITFVILIFTIIAVSNSAYSDISFTVSPMTVELEKNVGDVYTGVITVNNEGSNNQSLFLQTYIADWYLDNAGKQVFQKATTLEDMTLKAMTLKATTSEATTSEATALKAMILEHSCSKWITVNPSEFEISPGEFQEIRYTITVPPEANGDYWTTLFIKSIPSVANSDKPKNEAVMTGQIGTTIYVTTPKSKKDCKIESFVIDSQHAEITLKNLGQAHIRAEGELKIEAIEGKYKNSLEMPAILILPASAPVNTRKVSIDFKDPNIVIPKGKYQATLIIDYKGDVLKGARQQFTVEEGQDSDKGK
jgi:P pilus assembly chaperone PapD